MHRGGLAISILEHIASGTMQNARPAMGQRGSVIARGIASTTSFNADEFNIGVLQEWVEHASGIGATSDASHNTGRKSAYSLLALCNAFAADH